MANNSATASFTNNRDLMISPPHLSWTATTAMKIAGGTRTLISELSVSTSNLMRPMLLNLQRLKNPTVHFFLFNEHERESYYYRPIDHKFMKSYLLHQTSNLLPI